MLAARLYGIGDLRVADEPGPEVPPGHSLVRVTAVGLCGSDLHWYAEGGIGDAVLRRPLVIGHELAGVIEGGPRHGQPVAIDPAIACGTCRACRDGDHNLCPDVRFAGHGEQDGGLRELMAWPDGLLHPLPAEVPAEAGAMLEPLGVALHALDLGRVRVGATVAVVGCGPIGLLLVQVARLAGAALVVAADPLPHRLDAAGRFGAVALESSAAVGVDADVVFEVAGPDAAVRTALEAARPGARVVLVGIPDGDTTTFPASLARRKGLTLLLARRMNDTYPRAIDLVRRGAVDVASVVTARYPLTQASAALADAVRRTGGKVVVRPGGPD
jgi:L-iditol 2-dehydrogenase